MRKILGYIYIGYYGLIFIGLFLILYPFLWILLSRKSTFYYADKLRKFWGHASSLLGGMLPIIDYEERIDPRAQYVYCANHMSYLDIVLTGGFLPTLNFFMAKMELKNIPLFKIWFETIDVPVKRESLRSSHGAFVQAGEKLDDGMSLIIFPEGRIPKDTPKVKYPLKLGAFKLAIEKQLPVVPVSILDNYKRLDSYTWSASPGKMRMKVHKPIETKGLSIDDSKELAEKVYSIINQDLQNAGIV
ncbi:MAG: 1-acyl-sn-glycerol-3-phosphate acyltransferase [Bacteroidia bacterium]